jgi:hypothetical protein
MQHRLYDFREGPVPFDDKGPIFALAAATSSEIVSV